MGEGAPFGEGANPRQGSEGDRCRAGAFMRGRPGDNLPAFRRGGVAAALEQRGDSSQTSDQQRFSSHVHDQTTSRARCNATEKMLFLLNANIHIGSEASSRCSCGS